jgi:hypothetical protein
LAEQLAGAVPAPDRIGVVDDLAKRFEDRQDGLRTAIGALFADNPKTALIVVDQFEEILTHLTGTPDLAGRSTARAERLIANLVDAAENSDGRIRVLITLRADFIPQCLEYPQLRSLLENNQLLLGELGPEALREAVKFPARKVGAFFENGLVELILRDVQRQRGSLPLLQHALKELWQARRGPWLTLDAYEKSGGVAGALRRRAQYTYEKKLQNDQQRAIARNIFLRLTTLGEGVSDSRRRTPRAELFPSGIDPRVVNDVVAVLSDKDARLVVVNGDDTIEVTHETLIQTWDTLHGWIDANRQQLRRHRRLTESANEWEENKEDPSILYRGVRLDDVKDLQASPEITLNKRELAFLEASVAERKRQEEEKQRKEDEKQRQLQERHQFLVGAAVLFAVLFIAATGFAIFGFLQKSEAVKAERTANEQRDKAKEAASQALEEAFRARVQSLAREALVPHENPDLNLLLAMEAVQQSMRKAVPPLPQAVAVLRQVLFDRGGIPLVHPNPSDLRQWYSTNRRWLITPNPSGGFLKLWDFQADVWPPSCRELPLTRADYEPNGPEYAISEDGRRIVSSGANQVLQVVSLAAHGSNFTLSQASLERPPKGSGFALSPEGRWLLIGDDLYDLSHLPTSLVTSLETDAPLPETSVSSKDERAPVVEGERVLWQFTSESGYLLREERRLVQPGERLFHLLQCWDLAALAAGRSKPMLIVHHATHAVIAPGGNWLFAWLEEPPSGPQRKALLKCWKLRGGAGIEERLLAEHEAPWYAPPFLSASPDGHWIVAGRDGLSPMLFELGVDPPRPRKLDTTDAPMHFVNASFTEDSRWLALGGEDVCIWDLPSLEKESLPSVRIPDKDTGFDHYPYTLEFAANGKYLIRNCSVVRVWQFPHPVEGVPAALDFPLQQFSAADAIAGRRAIVIPRNSRGFGGPALWPYSAEDLLAGASTLVQRDLTDEEWAQYVGQGSRKPTRLPSAGPTQPNGQHNTR